MRRAAGRARDRGRPPRAPAAGLELSAYRIVQEALTNSLKHAGPATATVSIRYRAEDLELRIADTGAAHAAPAAVSGGRGIPGMRERVGVYGGELHAGREQRRLPRAGATPAGDAMIRVLLVDDEALVRGGFRAILEAQADIEVVAEAGDGSEAVALVEELGPDVVVMDIRMPGVDGIDATRRIAARRDPATHVLILTTFGL